MKNLIIILRFLALIPWAFIFILVLLVSVVMGVLTCIGDHLYRYAKTGSFLENELVNKEKEDIIEK